MDFHAFYDDLFAPDPGFDLDAIPRIDNPGAASAAWSWLLTRAVFIDGHLLLRVSVASKGYAYAPGFSLVATKRGVTTAHRLVCALIWRLDPSDRSWVARHAVGCPRNCILPGHLRPGSARADAADRALARRAPRGRRNPNATIDEELALTLRIAALIRRPGWATVIAKTAGVTPGTVSGVFRGDTWRHVEIADSIREAATATTTGGDHSPVLALVVHRLVRVHALAPRLVAQRFEMSEAEVRAITRDLDQTPVRKQELRRVLGEKPGTISLCTAKESFPLPRLLVDGSQAWGLDDLNVWAMEHLPLRTGRPPRQRSRRA